MLDAIRPGRQGGLRRNLSGELAYLSFLPSSLQSCLPLSLSNSAQRAVSDCRALLGEMQGMARFIPNVGMYLTMYVRKEALLSSQIEGTQCTFDDVLDPENEKNASRDLEDVINYVSATERAVELMGSMPLCTRLLRMVHETLLAGVRGSEKHPGELRTSQNWIGPNGCTLNEAAYVPPNVDDMRDALSDLEAFLNEEHTLDPIVKAGLVHYQFETIHPFLDGNGRMSRLLSLLLLYKNGFDAGKYVSFEEQISNYKAYYYEALRQSSVGWEAGENSYFPFVENFLSTLYMCYKELDKRFAVVHGKKVTKKARVEATVLNNLTPISKAEICKILPDVSPTTVEAVLGAMVKTGSVKRIGAGRAARYIKA